MVFTGEVGLGISFSVSGPSIGCYAILPLAISDHLQLADHGCEGIGHQRVPVEAQKAARAGGGQGHQIDQQLSQIELCTNLGLLVGRMLHQPGNLKTSEARLVSAAVHGIVGRGACVVTVHAVRDAHAESYENTQCNESKQTIGHQSRVGRCKGENVSDAAEIFPPPNVNSPPANDADNSPWSQHQCFNILGEGSIII
jgi:hypothetical protein